MVTLPLKENSLKIHLRKKYVLRTKPSASDLLKFNFRKTCFLKPELIYTKTLLSVGGNKILTFKIIHT